jgi:hypothetical protein
VDFEDAGGLHFVAVGGGEDFGDVAVFDFAETGVAVAGRSSRRC